jgi:hypothetical protein
MRSSLSAANAGTKDAREFDGCSVTLGRWQDCNTFLQRHKISANLAVKFVYKDNIQVVGEIFGGEFAALPGGNVINISLATIAGFCLIDWGDGSATSKIRLFVPVNSAPAVSREKRVTATDIPLIHYLAVTDVICISFPPAVSCHELILLETEFLTVPLFETRVDVFDDTETTVESEQQFGDADIYAKQVHPFNAAQGEVNDVHWLVSVLRRRYHVISCLNSRALFFVLQVCRLDLCHLVMPFVLLQNQPKGTRTLFAAPRMFHRCSSPTHLGDNDWCSIGFTWSIERCPRAS